MLKRITDIILSLIGIALVIPFMPIIILLIKLDSKGPIFYFADRVGKDSKIFKIIKFRTMIETSIQVGESISPKFDPRVTSFGRFLRRTKMNELPQFINILVGDMTFVGPRPESPDLAELYPEEAKRVFSVKPGLVGPNVLFGRNEEEFFPPGADAKRFYIENILPPKNKLDLEYIAHPSLLKDFKYIFLGVKETLIGSVGKCHIQDNRAQIFLLAADLFFISTSYLFAYVIAFWNWPGDSQFLRALLNLPFIIIIRLLCNYLFDLYRILIRYISYRDIFGVLKPVTLGSLILFLVGTLLDIKGYSSLIAVLDGVCLIYLLAGLRFCLLFYSERQRRKAGNLNKHRILIYGAGDAGNAAYRALASREGSPFEIVGFLDDERSKYGKTLSGVKVLGNRYHINALARLYGVQEILISEPGDDLDQLTDILGICQQAGLKYRIFSSSGDLDTNPFPVKNIEFSDVLRVKRIHAEHTLVKEILRDKTVLINGAGGALGLELCRKILQMGSRRIIIVDRYESYLNELVSDLLKHFSPEMIVPVLNIADGEKYLEKVFLKYRPNIVFHAGMRKYVPFLGVDLGDVGRVNYIHTFALAKAAAKFRCELFVLISSLMAAKSGNGNLIKDSLRIAEVSLDQFFSDTDTRLVVPRICDIIENRGGIVSILEERLKDQGTVFLPFGDFQVYLMSKDSATEFVLQTLIEAHKNPYGKRIFNCDAGSPLALKEIIRNLVSFYGLKTKFHLVSDNAAQSERLDSQLIPQLSPSNTLYSMDIDIEEENHTVSNPELKSVFKNFVMGKNGESVIFDWRSRTQELIRIYKQSSHRLHGMPSGMT